MCKTRNSRKMSLDNRTFRVDGCLRDKLVNINRLNTKPTTLGSCCGHGRYPETIICISDLGIIYERNTLTKIWRTRNFYKTDADGYYYIPEISEPLTHNKLESDTEVK